MNTDMARIGPKPGQRSADPHRDYAMGLFDVIGELAGMLIAHGIITAEGLSFVMRRREQITREAFTEQQALPAKTLAEVAELWAKPAALAFPRDAKVIAFPGQKTDHTSGDGTDAA